MTHSNFPEVKTNRLLLTCLTPSDWEMISFLRTDKEVNKFVNRPAAETKEKAQEFIEKINAFTERQVSYYWKIQLHGNDQMIGSICLWNFSKDRKTAEIGYDLSPDYQGKGIMNESLNAVIEFGFQNLNLELIEAYTHYQNDSSKTLLERNGFNLVHGKSDIDNANNIVYALKNTSS